MQERHIKTNDLGWSEQRAQKSAQEMYDRMFTMRFLPPGRGLQVMGSALTEEKGLYAALNSCAFTSTENIDKELTDPFCFMMDASMLGIGVGFDTKGAGKLQIHQPYEETLPPHIIADSREGWVHSLDLLLKSYFVTSLYEIWFDYSRIRKAGDPIRGFGGISSGPEPLIKLHKQIRKVLDRRVGQTITIRDIVDIMNMIGVCVVSGGVRRTAQDSLGDMSEEFLTLKDYRWNPTTGQMEGSMVERAEYGFTSNNSIIASVGQDYSKVAHQTALNGEPGYFWLDNARAFSRMKDTELDNKDRNALGVNPCLSPDTLVMTRHGDFPISDLVGKEVEIWDGNAWFKTDSFRVTSTNQPTLIIDLGFGTEIIATPYHNFIRAGGVRIQAKDLLPGMLLQQHNYGQHTNGPGPKVFSVREGPVLPEVYCCTIPTTHAFALSCGIMIGQCFEQTLHNYEVCNLVETFPNNHSSLQDYLRTLKFAYLYAKTVTLGKTPWVKTNRVMQKNRRIGTSISGVAQFLSEHSLDEFRQWMEAGYDKIKYYDKKYSDWFGIPQSIKISSIKPSGSISLMSGATPGIHYPEQRYYIRRVRVQKNSSLIQPLKEAGYPVEDDVVDSSASVVEFPVFIGDKVRTVNEVSVWEQVALAAFIQKHWADNQVSLTASFNPVTEASDIEHILNYYQYQLKAISFLPRVEAGAYPQMPYEAITKEEYEERLAKLSQLKYNSTSEEVEPVRGCDSDVCSL
jgi:ribonucleotide reductase alpha subunit